MSFRNDGTRPGAGDGVSPPLAPSQGCEQETTTADTTERRHEAGRWRYHEGTRGTNKLGVF